MKIFGLAIAMAVLLSTLTTLMAYLCFRFGPRYGILKTDVAGIKPEQEHEKKPTSPMGYFLHNAGRPTIILAISLMFSGITARVVVSCIIVAIQMFNVVYMGTVIGVAMRKKKWLSLRVFLRYVLPHGIFEIPGVCTLWAMALLGTWSAWWLLTGWSMILVAGFIESRISDPYIEKIYNAQSVTTTMSPIE